jgi:hypothetical protein
LPRVEISAAQAAIRPASRMEAIMSFAHLPRMLLSETEGWSDLVRLHPSVKELLFTFVVPMSLIPAVMYAHAELGHPGGVFPLLEPTLSVREAVLVGGLFFAAEIAMVLLMAVFIEQVGESTGVATSYESAFTLAAIAPTPLWLASLALFVPSMWVNGLVVALAWIGCVALIRHGVRPLIGLQDTRKAHWMANVVTLIGVGAWVALMILLALLLSLVIGLR